MADPTVKVGVFADASQLKRELDKAQGQISSFSDGAKKSGELLKNALFGTAVIYGAKRLIDAGNEVVKVNRETERVLQSTGAAAWASKDQITGMATSLMKLSGVDDEVIQAGENLLLTFTRVKNQAGEGNDVFDRGTRAALDMSAALGTDLNSSVLQLGKALNDPITGMTALRRAGVSLTEDQRNLIKELQGSGDLLGAQKVILAEVEKEFGGAAAAAKTPMDELKVSLGNLEESVGGALLPAFNTLAGFVSTLADAFSSLPQPLQATVLGLGAAAYIGPKIVSAFKPAYEAIKKIPEAFDRAAIKAYDASGAIDSVGSKMGTFVNAAAAGAIAIGGLVAAYQIWQQAIHSTDDQIKKLGESQKEAAKTESFDQLVSRFNEINAQIGDLSNTIDNSSAPWDADYRAQLSSMGAELQSVNEDFGNTIGVVNEVSAATGKSKDEVLKWVMAQKDAGIVYSDAATAIAAYTGNIDGNTMSADQAKTAQDGLAQSIRDTTSATKEALDPFFAASQSLDRLQDAQTKAYLAALNYGEGSNEARQANEDLARAALDTDGTLSALAAQMAESGQSTDEMKAAFQRWVDQGWITQDQANQIIGKFDDLKGKAEAYAGDYTANVAVNGYLEAQAALSALQYQVTALDGRTITVTAQVNARTSIYNDDGTYNLDNNPATGGGRAFAGPVKAGVAYPVGEHGKEYFRPAMDGWVMNGSTPPAATGGAGTSISIGNITLPNVTDADSFVDALKKWTRANGPLPVPVA